MVRLTENIDRFVMANPNLTEEQKKEIIEFFNAHPQLNGVGEGKIDWQKVGVLLKYEDFKKVMNDYLNRKHSKKKGELKGLDTLKEGVDYSIVYNNNGVIGYEVLTFKGSSTLASNDVAPEVWSDVDESYRNAEGFKGNVIRDFTQKEIDGKTVYGGAKWCTAYKSDSSHWKDYSEAKMKFVYLIGNVPTGKVAIAYLPKEYWSKFYQIMNGGYTIAELGGKPVHDFFDECFKNLPLELILRQNFRSIWNAYNEEVLDNPEYEEVNEIADKIIGSTATADSIKFFMLAIGAEKDGKMWSRRKGICGDRTPNFIKEHHISRRYVVKEGKLRAKWNFWEGTFDCTDWGLETLENMPRVITGDFICKHNLEDFTENDIPEGTKIYGRKIFE